MMARIGVGSDVMAPHPRSGILKTAQVLLIMPELCIVEFYEDQMRYCLPKNLLRAPFSGTEVTHALAIE